VIPDSELTPQRLEAEAMSLLDDGQRLSRMAVAAARLARPDAAERIAAEVLAGARESAGRER
jgi:UDP-N-acetylglucosamine:LPS N-acetylglucosamine transferase